MRAGLEERMRVSGRRTADWRDVENVCLKEKVSEEVKVCVHAGGNKD